MFGIQKFYIISTFLVIYFRRTALERGLKLSFLNNVLASELMAILLTKKVDFSRSLIGKMQLLIELGANTCINRLKFA